jgi:hypothetical protein
MLPVQMKYTLAGIGPRFRRARARHRKQGCSARSVRARSAESTSRQRGVLGAATVSEVRFDGRSMEST